MLRAVARRRARRRARRTPRSAARAAGVQRVRASDMLMLALLAVHDLTVATAGVSVGVNIDWAAALSRHDPVWRRRPSADGVPTSAAFAIPNMYSSSHAGQGITCTST